MRRHLQCLTILAAFTLTLVPIHAKAATRIVCEKSTITKLRLPAGPYGYQVGDVSFSDHRFAQLWGDSSNPNKWDLLRVGDHVQTCVDNKSITGDSSNKKYKIFVVDFDANFWFDSTWGAEGA
jgi:hypothetical protein